MKNNNLKMSHISKIHQMKLHEILVLDETFGSEDSFVSVMRVSGGWIYRVSEKADSKTLSFEQTFVPYSDDLKVIG